MHTWPTIIIARQIAITRTKAELARQGIKIYRVKASDITRMANEYLGQHPELLAEADVKIETSPGLKRIVDRERKRLGIATSVAGRRASPTKPCLHEQRKREAMRQWQRICPPAGCPQLASSVHQGNA
jgi:hypothetical protein